MHLQVISGPKVSWCTWQFKKKPSQQDSDGWFSLE
jgi:hypothetical protein